MLHTMLKLISLQSDASSQLNKATSNQLKRYVACTRARAIPALVLCLCVPSHHAIASRPTWSTPRTHPLTGSHQTVRREPKVPCTGGKPELIKFLVACVGGIMDRLPCRLP